MNKKLIILLIIILGAVFLRFVWLGRADVVYDESINSFRSLGYLDFFAEAGQETSINWFTDPPAWSKLSFHDHPPLSFLLNGLFLNLFGPTPFAVRFLSALSGLVGVFLIYLIGKKLFSQNVGLLAAGILAINNFAIWISRIGLQESLLIALILASFYFFILALEKRNYLFLAALFLALGFLTKYTAIFLAIVYFLIIFLKKRNWLKTKELYLSLILFLIIISPILIYNGLLYKNFGHFDLQLSYFFGLQDKVPGWQNLPGKSELSIAQRFIQLPLAFGEYLSPIFLGLLILSLVYFIWAGRKQGFSAKIILLLLLSLILVIGLTGPEARFLTLFTPFFALIIAVFLAEIIQRKKIIIGLIIIFFAFEIFYSINTFLLIKSVGWPPLAYSDYLKRLRGNWGFNNLDKYLASQLAGKVPAQRFAISYSYLEKKVNDYVQKAKGEEEAIILIYDFNLKDGPDIWYLKRREFYQGWPLITADNFIKELREKGPDYYLAQGFKQFYFIQAANGTLLKEVEKRSEAGKQLGDSLLQSGVEPEVITNLEGEISFLVYKF